MALKKKTSKKSSAPVEKSEKVLKGDALFLAIVLVLAAGFRLFLLRYQFAVASDEVNYLKLAANAAAEGGIAGALHPFWPPFYPLAVALFSKAGFGIEWAGRLVSVLSGTLTLLPVYVLAHLLDGRRIARAAVLALAFFPPVAYLNTSCLAESLYTFLVVTGMALGWFCLSGRAGLLSLLVGLLFGAAYLTRPEGIGFLIVFVGLAGVLGIREFVRNRKKQGLIVALLAGIGCAAVVSPYVLYLHRAVGRWTISGKMANQQGEALALMNNPAGVDPIRSLSEDNTSVPIDELYHTGKLMRVQREKGETLVRITPALFLKKYIRNMTDILDYRIPKVLTTFVFLLMVLGLFGEPWPPVRAMKELYLLAYVVFFWFLVIPCFHVTDRYFISFLPICFIWAAKGFFVLVGWLESGLRVWFPRFRTPGSAGKWAFGTILFLVMATLYAPTLVKIASADPWSSERGVGTVDLKEAGLWLKDHGKPGPVIMGRNHTVDFYAGNRNIAESVTIPKNTLDRVLAYAENRHVDYIVCDGRYKTEYPLLADLFDGKDGIPELRRIYDQTSRSGVRTIIYERVQVSHAK